MPTDSPSSPSRPLRRVLVVTGDHSVPDPTKWDGRYAAGDLELHAGMRAALESLPGYAFEFLTDHDRLFDRLRRNPPDFVLNFCDTGFRNVATQELHVPALLELCDVPYSGAPPACMVLCYDKSIVRLIAQAHGVPVPHESYVAPEQPLETVEVACPALIKPAQGDGSVGITADALVRTPAEARRYLDWFRRELPGRAALIQEYLPGAEYGLALVGNPAGGLTAFPPLEVDYSALAPGLAPILAFESKTGPETPYSAIRIRRASLDEATRASLVRHAELLFDRLQCRDYARFDFRADAAGQIKLLEVNPNPAWSSEGKLALMAGFAEVGYAALLGKLLEAGQARYASGTSRSE